jgi:predicted DNA-binding transcriptional regulator AlpA
MKPSKEDKAEGVRLFLAAEQAAVLCGISLRSWWRMDAAGHVPAAVRVGSYMKRWRLEELRRWIDVGCPPRGEWEQVRKASEGRK